MFIFIGCSGGGTSSMFCQKITQASRNRSIRVKFYDVQTILDNPGTYGNADAVDVVLAYGGIDFIRPDNLAEFTSLFDVVLVAPQMRYRTQAKQDLLKDYPVIVQDLDPLLFGRMRGELALDELLDLLVVLDEQRGFVSEKRQLNKSGDKNMEIFILGGDRKQVFFREFIQTMEQQDLRIIEESYHLESLYKESQQEFDLRILYGNSSAFTEKELPKLAKRIDLILTVPLLSVQFDQKRAYIAEYQIPILTFDRQNYGRGDGAKEFERLAPELVAASVKTEYSGEITIPKLEAPKIRRKKIGLLSWRTVDRD